MSGLDEKDMLRMLRSMVPRRLDREDILTQVERKTSVLAALKAEEQRCQAVGTRVVVLRGERYD